MILGDKNSDNEEYKDSNNKSVIY